MPVKRKAEFISPLKVTTKIIRDLMKKRLRPICAKCNKVVDSFDCDIDDFNSCYLTFKVRCHNQEQDFTIHKGWFLIAEDCVITKRAFESDAPTLIDLTNDELNNALFPA